MDRRKFNNGRRLAVGLRYEKHNDAAPCMAVKGEQHLADEIVKIAQRYCVPLVEDQGLAYGLKALDLDEEIPESLYEPVAVLLQHLAQLRPSSRSR